MIEADLSISLTRLRHKGGIRLYCLTFRRFPKRTVTSRNRHAIDFPAGITGEAKAIDLLVALIESAPQTRGGAKLLLGKRDQFVIACGINNRVDRVTRFDHAAVCTTYCLR